MKWDRNRKYITSIFDAIGMTPLLRLNKLSEELGVNVLAKLEWFSPSGSLKDRIYHHMFEKAEKEGKLKKGMIVLECSTGNAGISCAFVSAVKGYKCIIVMPRGMSEERKKLDRAYGAELVLTEGGESDVDLALEKVEEIYKSDPSLYWVPAQFSNLHNVDAHYLTTAPEIWEQTDGKFDAFVASQGTGGTISGVAQYSKERGSKARFYAVEPSECPLLSKREWGPHGIEGIGDGFVPRNLILENVDGVITTSTQESVREAKKLAKEGLFVGISSGCNIAAIKKLVKKHPDIKTVVTMLNDTGQRYFTTALCGEEKHLEIPEREHPMDDYTKKGLDKNQVRWDIIN